VETIHPRSPVVVHPENFAAWLDVRNDDAKDLMPMMQPQQPDYFAMEPTVIIRNAPPPKPATQKKNGGQMSLL
jgi:putative SOS response-associated peptidase YedK